MRRLLVLASLLSVALAGCAGGSRDEAEDAGPTGTWTGTVTLDGEATPFTMIVRYGEARVLAPDTGSGTFGFVVSLSTDGASWGRCAWTGSAGDTEGTGDVTCGATKGTWAASWRDGCTAERCALEG